MNYTNFIFNILPPILNFVGAFLLGCGYLVSNKQILKVSSAIWSGTDEQNIKSPKAREYIKQRKYTILGLVILAIGLILEITSNF